MLDKARAKGIKVHRSDLNEKLPFEDDTFDVVHANQLIEHLSDTDMFIKEVYRILKASGYLIISTPNLASFHNIICLLFGKQPYPAMVSDEVYVGTFPLPHPAKRSEIDKEPGPGHRRIFTFCALKEILEYHGFVVEKSLGSGFYPLPPPLARVICFLDKRHAVTISMKARKHTAK